MTCKHRVNLFVLLGFLLTLGATCEVDTAQDITPLATDHVMTATATRQLNWNVPTTLEDALYIAKAYIVMSPPYISTRTVSLAYVESTDGEARALFGRSGGARLPAEAEVWVFLANGQFVSRNRFTRETRVIQQMLLVIPRGERGGRWTMSGTGDLDLSSLGTVVDVPGPLPTLGPDIEVTPVADSTATPLETAGLPVPSATNMQAPRETVAP